MDMERENAFSESDVRLLQTLANSMSVALENARLFDETQRLLKETEQRDAELAVINSIQQGIAAELDFQAIVDLVGDKLREVFHTGDIGIRWYDPRQNLIHFLYAVRARPAAAPAAESACGRGSGKLAARARTADGRQQCAPSMRRWASSVVAAPTRAVLGVFVPILASDRVLGSVVIENYERENAFGESDVRLLTTVASSMGVALENARLFDETQRLLKETEQRNAELAIINSVQQGLAAELDFQAIIDLVGDKIAEIFRTRYIYMALHDPTTNLITMPYYLEHGERFPVEPFPLGIGLTGHVVRTREPLLINENFKARPAALGAKPIARGHAPTRARATWACRSSRATRRSGVIGTYRQREHAFGESDVRLLQTLANSMGIALENARLFDETQRRSRETAALAEVGRDISATLDLGTVMDRIARTRRSSCTRTTARSSCRTPADERTTPSSRSATVAEAIKATEIEAGSGIIGSLARGGPRRVHQRHGRRSHARSRSRARIARPTSG